MKIDIREILENDNNSLEDVVEAESIDVQPELIEEQEEETADEPAGVELESVDEPEDVEPEAADEPAGEPEHADKPGFWKLYGSLVAIGAAFVVLLVSMFAYTNLVPRHVSVTIDGHSQEITTYEHTVAGILTDQGIPYFEEDYLSTPPTGFIHDGMKFKLVHAADFKVTADGETVKCKSLKKTVGEALEDKGYKIGKKDIVTPSVETPLTDGANITVQRVKVKKITVKEKVPFNKVTQNDTAMNEGESKLLTEGKNGRDKVVYEVTYIDGKEAARTEISRETIKPAVDEVTAVGTRINYNGKSYSRKLVVKAYSYTGGGTTAMGTRARVGEIAVDPRVIPLGTNVYIEGVGARRAEDTGGNIKGNTIDIYMDTQAECIRWGVRYVTIYIE